MSRADIDLAVLDGLDSLLTADEATPETPAAPVPVPSAEAPTFDGALAEVRKQTRAGAAGALHSAVQVMAAAFDAGEADFDDALKAVPVLSKVVEHFEKMEAEEKSRNPGGGVVLHFTIEMGGGISVEMKPEDVIDGQVSEVGDDEAERDALAPAAYEIDLASLLGEGGSE